ncbi:hypothetical protein K488DRAFT_88989 [Vararia minispora EC-137]|uniref:Uncharacterized protein n=1 Tax=Vararia minispora EC-137 TaxID=1314806 RepID=A0ACB8QBL4_9AGAM|nr:hypothetical protein K488DRAFT_88989 [Vararia minispora EC-137]
MVSSRDSSSFSRPYPPIVVKQRPAPASVTHTTATALSSGSKTLREAASMLTSQCSLSRQSSRSEILSAGARKRARKDSGVDENSADVKRPPRVRQRLSSMASTETLRDVARAASNLVAQASKHSLSRQSSTATLRRPESGSRPHAKEMEIPADSARARALRKVSNTVEFPQMSESQAVEAQATPVPAVSQRYPSRIPLPTSRRSSMVEHARKVDEARAHCVPPVPHLQPHDPPHQDLMAHSILKSVDPSAKDVDSTSAPKSTRFDGPEERFEIRVAPRQKHVEIWDKPDDYVYAWGGYLTFIDREYQGETALFPLHTLDIRCSTHSYEGRFSLESNAVPTYSVRFVGETVMASEVSELKRDFNYERGVVLQEDSWQADVKRPGHFYAKFFVPIPIGLFHGRDSRIFKLEATGLALDERTGTNVKLTSKACFDDISHLRKEIMMDSRRVTI